MRTTESDRAKRRGSEYRALAVEGPGLRAVPDERPTMFGYAAVFDQWTVINSVHEGHFLERFAPGAFRRTIREDGHRIKAILEHGFDPSIGDKPLGPITELREDREGLYFEVRLIETSYNADLIAALESDGNLYGMSFRFRVKKEGQTWNNRPGKSAHNPRGLPERTVTEARVMEISATTWPAYEGTSASVRQARTAALADAAEKGKPWTAHRRRALLRAIGAKGTRMSADERKATLAAMGLAPPEPMSARERRKKLRRMNLVK